MVQRRSRVRHWLHSLIARWLLLDWAGLGCEPDPEKAEEYLTQAKAAAQREKDTDLARKVSRVLNQKTTELRVSAIREALDWQENDATIAKNDGPSLVPPTPITQTRNRPRGGFGDTRVPAGPPAQIQVIDIAWQRSSTGSYVEVNGRVRNVSRGPLETVKVTVTFEDADGRLVKSSDSVLSPNPLESGQVGDFKAIERSDSRFDHYRVSFSKFAGAAIPHKGPD